MKFPITKKAFEEWLQEQSPNARFSSSNTQLCPMAKCISQTTKHTAAFVLWSFSLDSFFLLTWENGNEIDTRLPRWASAFVEEVDSFGGVNGRISPKKALEILNQA